MRAGAHQAYANRGTMEDGNEDEMASQYPPRFSRGPGQTTLQFYFALHPRHPASQPAGEHESFAAKSLQSANAHDDQPAPGSLHGNEFATLRTVVASCC